METKVESLEGNKVKVTVTVDAADIDGRIKKTYKDFARKYNFPGFRKGKAPRASSRVCTARKCSTRRIERWRRMRSSRPCRLRL